MFGLTEERYAQLIDFYDGDTESIEEIVSEWGKDVVNRGYDIFDWDGTGLLQIERIDEIGAFDGDEDAARDAENTGFCKIIPVSELPKDFSERYYCWIDTPENRKNIDMYCQN